MSNFHFGLDDYDLNYYPREASDGMGGVDWDKVERVEIECDVYVKERMCKNLIDPWSVHDSTQPDFECSECHATGHAEGSIEGGEYLFCPRCGAVVKKAVER